jgi:cobalt transporter subunit CbtB
MTAPVATTPQVVPVPLWAWALFAIALFSVFVITQENGAILSASQAQYLHELTHDARHALGVPCH